LIKPECKSALKDKDRAKARYKVTVKTLHADETVKKEENSMNTNRNEMRRKKQWKYPSYLKFSFD